jgi:hypothetical protein
MLRNGLFVDADADAIKVILVIVSSTPRVRCLESVRFSKNERSCDSRFQPVCMMLSSLRTERLASFDVGAPSPRDDHSRTSAERSARGDARACARVIRDDLAGNHGCSGESYPSSIRYEMKDSRKSLLEPVIRALLLDRRGRMIDSRWRSSKGLSGSVTGTPRSS